MRNDIAKYVGRTIDLLAYQGALPSGESLLTGALATETNSGQITTGIQKLSQRFLLILLTEKGSFPHLPLRGCNFLLDGQRGYWHSTLDVFSSFAAALLDIRSQLQLEESDSDPNDERFESAALQRVTFQPGSVSITVQVLSRAGTSREVIMPLGTSI